MSSSGARIEPVTDPDATQEALLTKTMLGPDGAALNVFATLAHRPQLLRRVNAMGGYFFVHGGIAVRERELVILRVAATIRCDYEIGQHRWIAAENGMSPTEIDAAIDPSAAHTWSDADAAVLAFADEALAHDTVSDATWESLGTTFDDCERMELLALVGFYRMLGLMLNGLGVELDASVAHRLP